MGRGKANTQIIFFTMNLMKETMKNMGKGMPSIIAYGKARQTVLEQEKHDKKIQNMRKPNNPKNA
jgi:hypothetical protein